MSTETVTVQTKNPGVLWSYQLDGHGGGVAEEAGDTGNVSEGDGFHWYHLQVDDPNALDWLRSQSLDPNVIDAVTEIETRPRAMSMADGMLVVLRGVNTNPGSDPEDMVSIRFWFTEKMVISTRRRKLLSIEDVRNSIENHKGPKTPAEFVVMVIERLADRIGTAVDKIDDELSDVEDGMIDQKGAELRRQLSVIRRQTASIRRYLAPQREALATLLRSHGVFGNEEIHVLHLETDRMTRYVEDLELARERSLLLQEELQSRNAEEQNARMYVLSIVAAIFLPLSFLTGVFGMNVAGLPGTENPAAFLFLAVGMGLLGVGLIGFMRWSKWL